MGAKKKTLQKKTHYLCVFFAADFKTFFKIVYTCPYFLWSKIVFVDFLQIYKSKIWFLVEKMIKLMTLFCQISIFILVAPVTVPNCAATQNRAKIEAREFYNYARAQDLPNFARPQHSALKGAMKTHRYNLYFCFKVTVFIDLLALVIQALPQHVF